MSRATLWVLAGIFAVVLAICIVGAVLAVATSSEDVDVNLGDDEFQIEDIEARADLVAEQGPLVFADPTGGNRPIIVNHLGDDPTAAKQTFFGQTTTEMESQLAQVIAAYDASPAFSGLAVHDAASYAAMTP